MNRFKLISLLFSSILLTACTVASAAMPAETPLSVEQTSVPVIISTATPLPSPTSVPAEASMLELSEMPNSGDWNINTIILRFPYVEAFGAVSCLVDVNTGGEMAFLVRIVKDKLNDRYTDHWYLETGVAPQLTRFRMQYGSIISVYNGDSFLGQVLLTESFPIILSNSTAEPNAHIIFNDHLPNLVFNDMPNRFLTVKLANGQVKNYEASASVDAIPAP